MPRRPNRPPSAHVTTPRERDRPAHSDPPMSTATPMPAATADALAALGLTPLEAEAYRFVLAVPQATGYRIAQALGKPVGNVYKTIESLEAKGAVMTSDDDGTRVVAAIPAEEWIRSRRDAFESACTHAAAELAAFADAPEGDDDRVYHLADGATVVERARSMLRQARRLAILSVAPAPLVPLIDDLHRAARRGVSVACKVFEPCDIPGAETVVDPRGRGAVDGAPGEWLVLSVDGRSSLQALFRHGGDADDPTPALHMATYTTNPLLSWSLYSGLSSDLLLASLRRRIAEGVEPRRLARELERLAHLESPASAGKLALGRRFRAPPRKSSPRDG